MNLSIIDWAIVLIAVVILRYISLRSATHMKGVADFLSANRSAGRYLLTIAGQMGGTGVISFVAMFELYYQAGFTPVWWQFMSIPVGVIILLTGWIFYRFRETRALTLAQFFEMRYNRRFRIFAGMLCFISGILNFGIFPAVAARFFIYFCGLPDYFHIPFIPFGISTFASIMIVDLALALLFVTKGGQVSIMITECAQGLFCGFAFVIISVVILLQLKWPIIVNALNHAPANASMFNPYNTSKIGDFNIWYFLIGIVGSFYGYMAWQGSSGFNSSARTPHEQKMGGILNIWRSIPATLMTILLTIAAYAVMHLPAFSGNAATVNEALKGIGNDTIRNQMIVPLALANFLPIGIKGLLATVMIFVSFTCHDTYIHSWGSIFIQDVYMPLRKKAIEPTEHIKLLKWSMIGVAAFSFLFSLLYPQNGPILMFMAITGTIWIAGAGIVIIGGLYWKKGTTSAAYCALITGAIFGVIGLILPEVYKKIYHVNFPINNQWLYFIAICLASLIYIIVSLVTGSRAKKDFNIDKMLNRGKYAKEGVKKFEDIPDNKLLRIIGIDKQFSKPDKAVASMVVFWNFMWFAIFVIGTIINLIFHPSTSKWINFWHYYIWLNLAVSIPTTIWLSIGGIIDIKALFATLEVAIRNHKDDGRVVHENENIRELESTVISPETSEQDEEIKI